MTMLLTWFLNKALNQTVCLCLVVYIVIITIYAPNKPIHISPKYINVHSTQHIEINENNVHAEVSTNQKHQGDLEAKQNSTIWASMGLCYNENTHEYNKGKYPYRDVTVLSILLWGYHVPQAKTIINIIYTGQISSMMTEYGRMLERAGAVVQFRPAGGMDCVLKAQLIRLVAGDHPQIMDWDIVVTVDVNLFVVNDNVIKPFRDFPEKLIWIPQYEETVDVREGTGETFNQNLIGMRASTWRQILNYRGDINTMLEQFRTTLKWEETSTWYTDQRLTTYAILKSGICTAPKTSGLWNMRGLVYNEIDDSETCFHGRGYKDCNRLIHIVYQGCKWYHFFPDETFNNHFEKFKELTNNSIQLDIKVLTR